MANSRIMLTCKHCGEQFAIGKGYFGSYFTRNEKMHEQLNDFYSKHSMGECTDEIDCSDDAKDHFLILEEGDSLDVAEVKHSEWILHNDGSGTCKQCGFTQRNVWDYDNWQNFCGHCGAKMDGKGDSE